MNTRTCFRRAAAVATVMILSTVLAKAQDAAMTIVPNGSAQRRVTINDSGNHAWTLQTSSDFKTWTDAATWKVHNGSFHQDLDQSVGSIVFYRASYYATQQNVFSTTANALLIPSTPLDYTLPLPPYYLAPPVRDQDN